MKFITDYFAEINGKVPMIEFVDSLFIKEYAKKFECKAKFIIKL